MVRIPLILTLAVIFAFLLPQVSSADSPITSTHFSEAYSDMDIVGEAEADGVMTLEIAEYLSSPSNPVDMKVAVINALGWDFNGNSNAELYLYYLALKYQSTLDELEMDSLSADEMLCLGYLMVMDDYFNPEEGIPFLQKANKLREDSFTFAIVLALAKAQRAMDRDWCHVWRYAERVFTDDDLELDMRDEARNIIYEYMVLYREYCD